jgi:hypothetical protein
MRDLRRVALREAEQSLRDPQINLRLIGID